MNRRMEKKMDYEYKALEIMKAMVGEYVDEFVINESEDPILEYYRILGLEESFKDPFALAIREIQFKHIFPLLSELKAKMAEGEANV